MSRKKPDLSKIKKQIAKEPVDEPAPKPAPEKPQMSKEMSQQIRAYAKDVEEMRHAEEQEKEPERIELEELPDSVSANPMVDTVFYRNTPSDNPEIRAKIEAACEEMDFSDLVLTGRVLQEVPILSNKLTVRYRSLLASENFWIERRAEDEAATDWGLRSWMGYARLVLSLENINGNTFNPYEKKDGSIDTEAFNAKFKKVMHMGEKLVELLLIHLHWFNDRVDRLYTDDFEKLKNG